MVLGNSMEHFEIHDLGVMHRCGRCGFVVDKHQLWCEHCDELSDEEANKLLLNKIKETEDSSHLISRMFQWFLLLITIFGSYLGYLYYLTGSIKPSWL